MKCEQCGIIFTPKIDIPTRFHDENCRRKWHNEKRRLDKLAVDALNAIEKLQQALEAQNTHSPDVYMALDKILWSAKPRMKQVCKCGNCGQQTFVGKVGKCDFCGKEDWQVSFVATK